MILYNITYNIDRDTDHEWMEWLRDYYIPKIMSTGYFKSYKVFRMLQAEEDNSINYAVQFFLESISDLNNFLEKEAVDISARLQEKFRYRHVAFMSVLQDTGL